MVLGFDHTVITRDFYEVADFSSQVQLVGYSYPKVHK